MATKNRKVLESELVEIVERRKDELLAISGVTSCGIGYRIKNGVRTNDLCVQCTVEEKMSLEKLAIEGVEPLPQQIEDDGTVVAIDVVERSYMPHYELGPSFDCTDSILSGDAEGGPERTHRLDEVSPGCSVSNVRSTAGTLGAIVYDVGTGRPMILSNWHVLHGPDGQLGDAVVQPGRLDDPNIEHNQIGRLVRSHLGPAGDCAVASIENRRMRRECLELNVAPNRTATVSLGDRVVKSGRTTGVTFGVVSRVGVIAKINYGGDRGIQCIKCFEIAANPLKTAADGEISSGGDSGSLWTVDADGEERDIAVGLHFAGESDPSPSAEHALACPIRRVLDLLNVSLTPPTKVRGFEDDSQSEGLMGRLERLEIAVFGSRATAADDSAAPGNLDADHGETDPNRSVLESDSNRNEVRA